MAEVVKKLSLPRPTGFLYFVEADGTVWKHAGGEKTVVSDKKIDREPGYLYFIDMNGHLARKPNLQQRDAETNKLFKDGTQSIVED
tara:strand:+ start:283 stop:540 length:258 start_codon:yes stop_codon:yes gene_type:complete